MGFGFKYVVVVLSITLLFVNFISCGAQLYQVSMQGDHEARKISQSASDPSSPLYGLHSPGGWTELPIRFRVSADMNEDQKAGLSLAMETWEMAAGKKLFRSVGEHTGTTGDSFKDLYSSLSDGINGHYLDGNWAKTGKPTIVLATTIWDNEVNNAQTIKTADIRFNSNYYKIGDSFKTRVSDSREVVDMQTLALHELGHLLGLAHVIPEVDAQSIMNASLYIGEGLANRRLSAGDIERLQKIYGCQGESCNIEVTLAKIEDFSRRSREPANMRVPVATTAHQDL